MPCLGQGLPESQLSHPVISALADKTSAGAAFEGFVGIKYYIFLKNSSRIFSHWAGVKERQR